MSDVTRAEVCAVACADTWRDAGEVLAHAVGILPSIGARLAKLTTNPELVLSDGDAFLVAEPPPLGAANGNGGVVESWAPLRRIFDIVATGRRQSMMGASQIDQYGNQNISLIGDWRRPRRQLIGVRGAPGNTVNHQTNYWVSKHSAKIFVPKVDLVSGVGNDNIRTGPRGATRFHDLAVVVTNLGVLDYNAEGRLRLRSTHPGVTVAEIQQATGFNLDVSSAGETRIPTAQELELIRTVIDPGRTREREVPATSTADHRAAR